MLPDWIELCALFVARSVDYLIVGGQAVVAHGYPRLTKDLDLLVRPTEANGSRVLAALEDFGMSPSPDIEPGRFTDPALMLVLGLEPFSIDILTSIPGIEFDDAWSRRTSVTLDGHPLPLISKPDLIASKRALGRLQDLADAEALEAIDS